MSQIIHPIPTIFYVKMAAILVLIAIVLIVFFTKTIKHFIAIMKGQNKAKKIISGIAMVDITIVVIEIITTLMQKEYVPIFGSVIVIGMYEIVITFMKMEKSNQYIYVIACILIVVTAFIPVMAKEHYQYHKSESENAYGLHINTSRVIITSQYKNLYGITIRTTKSTDPLLKTTDQ